jgi:hypothetical protein
MVVSVEGGSDFFPIFLKHKMTDFIAKRAVFIWMIALEIILFPLRKEPETGSRIPSISTGGAAMKAIINTEVAINKVGIINTPNHPM